MEMSVNSEDNQTKEADIQSFLKKLQTIKKETKQMEEQMLKMRVELALRAIELSTKVETNQSLLDDIEMLIKLSPISRQNPNPDIKPIKAEDNETND